MLLRKVSNGLFQVQQLQQSTRDDNSVQLLQLCTDKCNCLKRDICFNGSYICLLCAYTYEPLCGIEIDFVFIRSCWWRRRYCKTRPPYVHCTTPINTHVLQLIFNILFQQYGSFTLSIVLLHGYTTIQTFISMNKGHCN